MSNRDVCAIMIGSLLGVAIALFVIGMGMSIYKAGQESVKVESKGN